MSGDIAGCYSSGRGLLASSGQRPGLLLNIPQCTGWTAVHGTDHGARDGPTVHGTDPQCTGRATVHRIDPQCIGRPTGKSFSSPKCQLAQLEKPFYREFCLPQIRVTGFCL